MYIWGGKWWNSNLISFKGRGKSNGIKRHQISKWNVLSNVPYDWTLGGVEVGIIFQLLLSSDSGKTLWLRKIQTYDDVHPFFSQMREKGGIIFYVVSWRYLNSCYGRANAFFSKDSRKNFLKQWDWLKATPKAYWYFHKLLWMTVWEGTC